MDALGETQDFWVFGYGSLMWRPGFAYEERAVARLYGFHRALCVYSPDHRGTPEAPGLVVGLDAGGSCVGMAYRVAGALRPEVLAYLDEREKVTGAYREAWHRVHLPDGRAVVAQCWAVNRRHALYAGALSLEDQLAIVTTRAGTSGANRDYILNTARHLDALGIDEGPVHRLAAALA